MSNSTIVKVLNVAGLLCITVSLLGGGPSQTAKFDSPGCTQSKQGVKNSAIARAIVSPSINYARAVNTIKLFTPMGFPIDE